VIFPVYVGDVADGVLLALEHGRPGETYNLCGAPISHRDAFDVVCAEAGLRWPRLNLPGWMGIAAAHGLEALSALTRREPFYPINLRSYVYNDWHVSSEKARRELGFAPREFREGARRTIAWYRTGQPDWIPELACENAQA
jgi:dihydroflavonol-4-reductase